MISSVFFLFMTLVDFSGFYNLIVIYTRIVDKIVSLVAMVVSRRIFFEFDAFDDEGNRISSLAVIIESDQWIIPCRLIRWNRYRDSGLIFFLSFFVCRFHERDDGAIPLQEFQNTTSVVYNNGGLGGFQSSSIQSAQYR